MAEHAVLVADRLRQQGHGAAVILAGLHHDDHEAYTGDIGRPMKLLLEARCPGVVREVEHALNTAIWIALGLPTMISPEQWAAVKAADEWALAAEAYYLMPSKGKGWVCDGLFDPDAPGVLSLNRLRDDRALPEDFIEEMWMTWHRRHVRLHEAGLAADL